MLMYIALESTILVTSGHDVNNVLNVFLLNYLLMQIKAIEINQGKKRFCSRLSFIIR